MSIDPTQAESSPAQTDDLASIFDAIHAAEPVTPDDPNAGNATGTFEDNQEDDPASDPDATDTPADPAEDDDKIDEALPLHQQQRWQDRIAREKAATARATAAEERAAALESAVAETERLKPFAPRIQRIIEVYGSYEAFEAAQAEEERQNNLRLIDEARANTTSTIQDQVDLELSLGKITLEGYNDRIETLEENARLKAENESLKPAAQSAQQAQWNAWNIQRTDAEFAALKAEFPHANEDLVKGALWNQNPIARQFAEQSHTAMATVIAERDAAKAEAEAIGAKAVADFKAAETARMAAPGAVSVNGNGAMAPAGQAAIDPRNVSYKDIQWKTS